MASTVHKLCEIRIPTYKRPELLYRALSSLLVQDYPHWQAIVMDDSPEQEGKLVVESLKDDRIFYQPNPQNLGSAGNIDQAFASHALLGGTYACVLEDDNWLLPNFLSKNMVALASSGVNLLLRNQQVWLQTLDESKPTSRTTRGDWFTRKIYTPLEIHAHLLYFEGISNGGLFWKTSIQSKLQVGPDVSDAGLQEYCRTLQIRENFCFEPEPLCCWSEMPIQNSLRNPVSNRLFSRGVQSIKRNLLQTYQSRVIVEAQKIAIEHHQELAFEVSLLDALFTKYSFQHVNALERSKRYCKSYLRYQWVSDPLTKYFAAPLRKMDIVDK